MSDLFEGLKQNLRRNSTKKIVFPEPTDERILRAASRLGEEELVKPILIGNEADVNDLANKLNVSISNCEIIDPANYEKMDEMVNAFVERRNGKVNAEEAKEILLDENYFGTMLV